MVSPKEDKENINMPVPQKSKSLVGKILPVVLRVLGVILVLAIIGIGALLAGHIWNPHWNPFKQPSTTDKVFREKTRELIEK